MSAARDLEVQYRENPNQRTLCVLVLDNSGSMSDRIPGSPNTRIEELNAGLAKLKDALVADETALARVQLSIICVGGVMGNSADVLMDWTDAEYFTPPTLKAGGPTPLGAGLLLALKEIESQKIVLRKSSVGYTRPWMIVMSDGEPTDNQEIWRRACSECRAAESAHKCAIFPVAVEDGDVARMSEIASTPPQRMAATNFASFFVWLSASLSAVSRSTQNEFVPLPNTSAWAYVQNR